MPSNACFSTLTSVGVPRLRRVLRGLAWLYPDIGYCQGTGMVSAVWQVGVRGDVQATSINGGVQFPLGRDPLLKAFSHTPPCWGLV